MQELVGFCSVVLRFADKLVAIAIFSTGTYCILTFTNQWNSNQAG
jgi:hypothetical protein